MAVTDGDGIKVANNQLTTVIVKKASLTSPFGFIRMDSQKTGMSLSGAEFALYATEEDAENDSKTVCL